MLRYFYLISLFIYMNATLLEAGSNGHMNAHKRRRVGRVKKSSDSNRDGLNQRYEYDYKSPVQQFDVASFVQGPDGAVVDEEPNGFKTKNGSRSSIHFDYDIGVGNEDTKKEETVQDYLHIGSDDAADLKFNSPLFKDAHEPKYLDRSEIYMGDMNMDDMAKPRHNKVRNTYKDYLMDQMKNHNPAKKCALKNLKFPFFSHNKSTLKPKKNKKRKLFCFNCPKNAQKQNGEILKKVESEPNIITKEKRLSDDDDDSYSPSKKKQHKIKDSVKRKKSSIIHNSRQFYQNKENLQNMERNAKQFTDNTGPSVGNVREKREEIDRERQLKELEEVQKKIDAVQIHMPSFEKKPAELSK